MSRKLLRVAAFVIGGSLAAEVTLAAQITIPGASLTIPGTSSTGVSFTYAGTLTQNDTIALSQTGNPCLQTAGSAYCTNGAGVVTVAGSTPVGGSSSFSGPSGVIPAGTWTFGALLMIIPGVGAVQVFPSNATNGLGSPTPPTSLTLPTTTLAGLGFPTFSVSNPTITFIVADTNFGDNGGQFSLGQGPATSVPTLGGLGMIAMILLLMIVSVALLRYRS